MVNFGYPYNDIVICKDSTDYLWSYQEKTTPLRLYPTKNLNSLKNQHPYPPQKNKPPKSLDWLALHLKFGSVYFQQFGGISRPHVDQLQI